MLVVPLALLLAGASQAAPTPEPERLIAVALEDARKAEQFLDAAAMGELIAASFTSIEDGARLGGAFAFLEPLRRQRQRGVVVHELTFQDVSIRVYGASAIASYTFHKTWRDGGRRHQRRGWSSDVFERRDDGAWILVHRHRCPDVPLSPPPPR
jgi:ketosteroid isomerase-like protein